MTRECRLGGRLADGCPIGPKIKYDFCDDSAVCSGKDEVIGPLIAQQFVNPRVTLKVPSPSLSLYTREKERDERRLTSMPPTSAQSMPPIIPVY